MQKNIVFVSVKNIFTSESINIFLKMFYMTLRLFVLKNGLFLRTDLSQKLTNDVGLSLKDRLKITQCGGV